MDARLNNWNDQPRFRELLRVVARYRQNVHGSRETYATIARMHIAYDISCMIERVRVRRQAPTNRVSSFTLCLLVCTRNFAKTKIDPRAVTFLTGTLHVPTKIHVEHDAIFSNPSLSLFCPWKSKANWKIYAHRSVVAARLDDLPPPRYYPPYSLPYQANRRPSVYYYPRCTYCHVPARARV